MRVELSRVGSVPLSKRPPKSPLPPCMGGHSQNTAVYEPGSRFPPHTKVVFTMHSSVCRTVTSNFFVVHKQLSLRYFVTAAQQGKVV